MKNSEEPKGHQKKAVKYEEAMNQAFSEIFQNLKVIEADNKKQRERLDLQRRRGSAPPAALRETTASFTKSPKTEVERKLSTPIPGENSTTTKWVLQCFEEENMWILDFNFVFMKCCIGDCGHSWSSVALWPNFQLG